MQSLQDVVRDIPAIKYVDLRTDNYEDKDATDDEIL